MKRTKSTKSTAEASTEALDVPKEVLVAATALNGAMDEVEAKLALLAARRNEPTGMTPLEVARVNLGLAYGLGSLVYVLLRTQGQSTQDHPVVKELQRVRHYMKKLATAAGAKPKQDTAKEPRSVVDTAAANRFVRHALSGADEHQEDATIQPDSDSAEEVEEEEGEIEEDSQSKKRRRADH